MIGVCEGIFLRACCTVTLVVVGARRLISLRIGDWG